MAFRLYYGDSSLGVDMTLVVVSFAFTVGLV